MSSVFAKKKRYPYGDEGALGGNAGESCHVEDMPDVEKCDWIQAWLGRGRECTGKFAAENIKEAAMQDAAAWIVTLALIMTVAFAQIMMLPAHIAQTTPDGFYGETMVRKLCVALYVMSFLVAALNVMRQTMWYTVRLICIAQTPAYLVASLIANESDSLPETSRLDFWFEMLMTKVFRVPFDPGTNIVEPNLLLMCFGYSIGLYLTQSWEIGLLCYGVVFFAYPSLRTATEDLFVARGKMVKSLPAWPPKDIEAGPAPSAAPSASPAGAPAPANGYMPLES